MSDELVKVGRAPPCPRCGALYLIPMHVTGKPHGWLACATPLCTFRLWLANFLPN